MRNIQEIYLIIIDHIAFCLRLLRVLRLTNDILIKKRGADSHEQASSCTKLSRYGKQETKVPYYDFDAKLLLYEDMTKDRPSGSGWSGQKEKRVAPLALIPEDVPIDLGVIATRIKVPPYCRIINAALEPLRQVLEVAALLAKVLGEIFGAIVFALVALLEIFERALIPIPNN